MKAADEVIEVNREELQAMLERKREALGEEDYQKLQKLLRAFSYLSDLIGEKGKRQMQTVCTVYAQSKMA